MGAPDSAVAASPSPGGTPDPPFRPRGSGPGACSSPVPPYLLQGLRYRRTRASGSITSHPGSRSPSSAVQASFGLSRSDASLVIWLRRSTAADWHAPSPKSPRDSEQHRCIVSDRRRASGEGRPQRPEIGPRAEVCIRARAPILLPKAKCCRATQGGSSDDKADGCRLRGDEIRTVDVSSGRFRHYGRRKRSPTAAAVLCRSDCSASQLTVAWPARIRAGDRLVPTSVRSRSRGRTAATAARPTPFTCSIVEEFWWPHATRRAKNQVARVLKESRAASTLLRFGSQKPSGDWTKLVEPLVPKRRHLRRILARVLRPQAQYYRHGRAVWLCHWHQSSSPPAASSVQQKSHSCFKGIASVLRSWLKFGPLLA